MSIKQKEIGEWGESHGRYGEVFIGIKQRKIDESN